MPQVKVSELSGPALDWAVAKCWGLLETPASFPRISAVVLRRRRVVFSYGVEDDRYSPSTNWSHGGPIIEREGVALRLHSRLAQWYATYSKVLGDGAKPIWARRNYLTAKPGTIPPLLLFTGPTPLIAAMRCYVASKLGDTIDVPSELI